MSWGFTRARYGQLWLTSSAQATIIARRSAVFVNRGFFARSQLPHHPSRGECRTYYEVSTLVSDHFQGVRGCLMCLLGLAGAWWLVRAAAGDDAAPSTSPQPPEAAPLHSARVTFHPAPPRCPPEGVSLCTRRRPRYIRRCHEARPRLTGGASFARFCASATTNITSATSRACTSYKRRGSKKTTTDGSNGVKSSASTCCYSARAQAAASSSTP